MSARAAIQACLIPFILGAAMIAGCAPRAGMRASIIDTAKIVDSIKTDEVHWNADYKSGDAAKVAAHYAPDAVVMSPGDAASVGTAAIKAANEQAFSDPQYGLSFSSDRVYVAASGDLAAAHGTYKETTTDPKTGAAVTAAGSYVTVYKPGVDGVWRAVWDINTPGAAAPREDAGLPKSDIHKTQ